jgi:hypothetical protein
MDHVSQAQLSCSQFHIAITIKEVGQNGEYDAHIRQYGAHLMTVNSIKCNSGATVLRNITPITQNEVLLINHPHISPSHPAILFTRMPPACSLVC